MKENRIRAGLAAFLLFASFLCGCTGQGKSAMAADISTDNQQVLINIADQLPRGGEAQLLDSLMFGEEEVAAKTGQEIAYREENSQQAEAGKPAAESETVEPTVKEILRIATVGSLNEELLEAAEPYLLKQGYGLEIISCEDYESPNTLLLSGEADANFFQHEAYLERYNQEKGTQLSSLGAVYYEPLGLYPGKTASLGELSSGSRIGVSSNPTGYARALFLLEQEGLLELASDADLLAVWEDVSANPKGLELVAMEEEELLASRSEMDMVVCSTGQALAQGLDPAGFLALESAGSLAAGSLSQILVVNGTEEEEGLQLLLEVLRSEEIKEIVSKQYHGSILLLE